MSVETLKCVDTPILQPLWILIIGIIFQLIISFTIIMFKMDYYEEQKQIWKDQVASKAGVKLHFHPSLIQNDENGKTSFKIIIKTIIRYILIIYQIISILSVFILDIIDISNKINDNNFSSFDNYNCMSQILIYSSNFKTILINLLIFILLGTINSQTRTDYFWPYISKSTLYIVILLTIPYLTVICTHFIIGLFVYIWYFIGLLIVELAFAAFIYFIILGINTCANTRQYEWTLNVIIATYLLSLLYFYILTTSISMCHFWDTYKYIDSFKATFIERHSNQYFDNLYENTQDEINNVRNIWRFLTYLF